MEDIRHSLSRMIHKIPKPSKKTGKVQNPQTKTGKVFSYPNLLHLPSSPFQQSASTQKRSNSASHITNKEHQTHDKASTSNHVENIESRIQNRSVFYCNPIYRSDLFASDEVTKMKTGKQKKIPPKRPPPPKVLPRKYQNNVNAKLHRSKSDSQTLNKVHADSHFNDGNLDKCRSISKTTENLNLNGTLSEFVGGYISMTGNDDDDVDDNGYVMMSRDGNMTS